MRARLSPPRVLLPHTYTQMDGFCNQNANKLRSLAGLSFPAVYAGFPMSAHLSRLRLFQRHLRSLFWVWVWVWDWFQTLLLTRSSPSRHPPFTQYPFPSRSLVRDGHTSPHMPRLVVPHSTCPSLSPSPPRTQVCDRSCSNKHTHSALTRRRRRQAAQSFYLPSLREARAVFPLGGPVPVGPLVRRPVDTGHRVTVNQIQEMRSS